MKGYLIHLIHPTKFLNYDLTIDVRNQALYDLEKSLLKKIAKFVYCRIKHLEENSGLISIEKYSKCSCSSKTYC